MRLTKTETETLHEFLWRVKYVYSDDFFVFDDYEEENDKEHVKQCKLKNKTMNRIYKKLDKELCE